MHVSFVIRSFHYYTVELANALVADGLEVDVIADDRLCGFVGDGKGDTRRQFRALLDPRVNVEWVHIPARTSLSTLVENLRCIRQIARALLALRPDAIHVHDVADYRVLAALLSRKTFRERLIVTVHDAALHPGDTPSRSESARVVLRRMARRVVVHGRQIKERLIGESGIDERKIAVVPHGALLLYRRWLIDEAACAENTALLFGRISLYKGFEYLIAASELVCREIPEAHFIVAGAGPDWPRCRALIRNPLNFTLLEGAIPDPDVACLFQRSTVVVLPYVEGSQSGVLSIAYAMRRPIIATTVGALPETVRDGVTGLLVPPRDPEALAEALVRLFRDGSLRRSMAEHAYLEVTRGDLAWPSIASRTLDVYREAIAEPQTK